MTRKPQPLTLAALQASPEYIACSPKMQVWLTTLITNGFQYTDATVAAYPTCKSRETARVFSHAIRHWPKIQAALNLYLNKSEREILLDKVRNAIRNAEAGSIAEQRLLAQEERLLFGGTPDAEDDNEPTTENPKPQTIDCGVTAAPATSRVPVGATPLVDAEGVVRGYRTADGQYVQLADVEVVR
jgi:hypothetical protein